MYIRWYKSSLKIKDKKVIIPNSGQAEMSERGIFFDIVKVRIVAIIRHVEPIRIRWFDVCGRINMRSVSM